jgi:RsiW-degrading membrane proteinase PrsW (M82 family)
LDLNLLITAVTPGIAFALIIYFVDRYDREPVKLLVKTFIGGALIVFPTVLLESFLSMFNIFGGLLGAAYTAFVVAGFSEEFFKRFVVMRMDYDDPAYDEKIDGIVYCVMASLGFATVENVMYVVFRFADVESVGLYRAFLSVPAHMLFAITMGYFLSMAKFCNDPVRKKYYYARSLTTPLMLHGIFDFILMSGNSFLMLIFFPYVIYLWRTNLRKLNLYYQESKDQNGNGVYSNHDNVSDFGNFNENDEIIDVYEYEEVDDLNEYRDNDDKDEY